MGIRSKTTSEVRKYIWLSLYAAKQNRSLIYPENSRPLEKFCSGDTELFLMLSRESDFSLGNTDRCRDSGPQPPQHPSRRMTCRLDVPASSPRARCVPVGWGSLGHFPSQGPGAAAGRPARGGGLGLLFPRSWEMLQDRRHYRRLLFFFFFCLFSAAPAVYGGPGFLCAATESSRLFCVRVSWIFAVTFKGNVCHCLCPSLDAWQAWKTSHEGVPVVAQR